MTLSLVDVGLRSSLLLAPLVGVMDLSACGDAGGADDGYALRRTGAKVVVGAAYLECAADGDCALVNVTCNACCERQAIASELLDRYEESRQEACASYRGPECSCSVIEQEARCLKGRCVAVSLE